MKINWAMELKNSGTGDQNQTKKFLKLLQFAKIVMSTTVRIMYNIYSVYNYTDMHIHQTSGCFSTFHSY